MQKQSFHDILYTLVWITFVYETSPSNPSSFREYFEFLELEK